MSYTIFGTLSGNSTNLSNYVKKTDLNTLVSKTGDDMTGELDMSSNKIINVSDPINLQDVATKNYIDTRSLA